MIYTAQHNFQNPNFCVTKAPIIVKDFAWISARAIILPGVVIGKGAVISAGAVVTKNVKDFDVVGGIPAKSIGT